MYTDIRSAYCIPEANIMLNVRYISILKVKESHGTVSGKGREVILIPWSENGSLKRCFELGLGQGKEHLWTNGGRASLAQGTAGTGPPAGMVWP